jgi:hypothetical protein
LLSAPVPSVHAALLAKVGHDAQLVLESARASVTLLQNISPPKPCDGAQADTGASSGHDDDSFKRAVLPTAEACAGECARELACEV